MLTGNYYKNSKHYADTKLFDTNEASATVVADNQDCTIKYHLCG